MLWVGLRPQFGLHIDTLLQQDSLEKGVLIAKHQTFISRMSMALLQALQRVFMLLDGSFQLLNVLGPPLAESSLGLAVALLPLLGRCIYLPSG